MDINPSVSLPQTKAHREQNLPGAWVGHNPSSVTDPYFCIAKILHPWFIHQSPQEFFPAVPVETECHQLPWRQSPMELPSTQQGKTPLESYRCIEAGCRGVQ